MSGTPNTYLDLFWGYSAIWGCLVFFIVKTMLSQRKLANEIAALRSAISTISNSETIFMENIGSSKSKSTRVK